jgi:hypothetical protein
MSGFEPDQDLWDKLQEDSTVTTHYMGNEYSANTKAKSTSHSDSLIVHLATSTYKKKTPSYIHQRNGSNSRTQQMIMACSLVLLHHHMRLLLPVWHTILQIFSNRQLHLLLVLAL